MRSASERARRSISTKLLTARATAIQDQSNVQQGSFRGHIASRRRFPSLCPSGFVLSGSWARGEQATITHLTLRPDRDRHAGLPVGRADPLVTFRPLTPSPTIKLELAAGQEASAVVAVLLGFHTAVVRPDKFDAIGVGRIDDGCRRDRVVDNIATAPSRYAIVAVVYARGARGIMPLSNCPALHALGERAGQQGPARPLH